MKYYGRVFRPPSEACSLIVQITIGCSHNKCTFCEMYKEKKFKIRSMDEVLADFRYARKTYKYVRRIFLADGDALIRKTNELKIILEFIKEQFPECERVTCYASPVSILIKSEKDLKELNALGLKMVYMGLESGSDEVLKKVNKGEASYDIVCAGKKIKRSGIKLSVTAISGLGGIDLWREHAIQTGKAFSQMKPDYIGLLTLMLEGGTPLEKDYECGKFKILTPEEVTRETILMLENIDCEGCKFRSNHASNYLALKGELNKDRQKMIDILNSALNGKLKFKEEMFRVL